MTRYTKAELEKEARSLFKDARKTHGKIWPQGWAIGIGENVSPFLQVSFKVENGSTMTLNEAI